MSEILELRQIRSQRVSIRLGVNLYDLRVYSIPDGMAFDMIRDEVTILSGFRIVPGTPLIPYGYLESGNFIMVIPDDELPDYNQFGLTQNLIFFSDAELVAIRGV